MNSLAFSNDGQLLVAGVGQEHKLGRWWQLKSAKNAVCIVRLKMNTLTEALPVHPTPLTDPAQPATSDARMTTIRKKSLKRRKKI